MKRCDGRNASCLPAAAFGEAGGRGRIMHTPLGIALLKVFFRTEKRRPRGDHRGSTWLPHSLFTNLARVLGDLSSFNILWPMWIIVFYSLLPLFITDVLWLSFLSLSFSQGTSDNQIIWAAVLIIVLRAMCNSSTTMICYVTDYIYFKEPVHFYLSWSGYRVIIN